jgi:hypothetical protein
MLCLSKHVLYFVDADRAAIPLLGYCSNIMLSEKPVFSFRHRATDGRALLFVKKAVET